MAQEVIKPMSFSKQRKSIGETIQREKEAQEQVKKITKTTVVNPRQIDWPDNIDDSSLEELKNCIKQVVSALKFPAHKVPLNEIRKIDKSKRTEFRRQWKEKHTEEVGFDVQQYMQLRSSLAIGVNCVSRALESNDKLAGVIIEKDVKPAIITKLLVPISLEHNVPIIAIDGLNEIFDSNIRLRCIALGLKRCCEKISHHFHPLLNLIQKHGKQYELEDLSQNVDVDTVTLPPNIIQPDQESLSEDLDPTITINVQPKQPISIEANISQETASSVPANKTKKGSKRKRSQAHFMIPKIRKTETNMKIHPKKKKGKTK